MIIFIILIRILFKQEKDKEIVFSDLEGIY